MSHLSAAAAPRALSARPGLSGTALKTIALVLMVLDHIHYYFEFTGLVPLWFTQLGRLSAPLFLFCTVEGFAHTHDRRKYFWRIWRISAGMGLLQFLMMYAGFANRPDGFVPMNAIFMNFVILIPIWQGIDWLRQRRIARGLAAVLIPLIGWPALFIGLYYAVDKTPLAWLLDSILAGIVYTVLPSWTFIMDGGITYILEGIVLYLLRRHRGWQAAAFVALGLLFYLALPMRYLMASGSFAPGLLFDTAFEWMGVFAVVPMLLYNGQRGRGMKQLFYVFYPAHVYLLYALSWGVLLLTQ